MREHAAALEDEALHQEKQGRPSRIRLPRDEHVPWRDQYIVDLEHGTIAKRPTLTPSEMLLRRAVHLTDNGKDIAEQFAKAHPVPRVRANAIAALAAVAEGEKRRAVLERGMRDRDARVRDDCRRWLAL